MDILITGSNGFIAKNISKEFSNNKITAITRGDVDLRDASAVAAFLKGKHYDVVLHTAAAGVSTPLSTDINILDENILMYYNILNNRKNFDRFINLGSGAEIYLNHYPYGLSKSLINKSISDKQNFFNLRLFGVFGSNELNTRFIKANLARYICKQPMIINQNKLMDFIYIKDLSNIIRDYIYKDAHLLNKDIDCVYKTPSSLYDIATYINTLSSYRVEIIIHHNGDAEKYTGVNTYNTDFIGLENGIKEMYDILKYEIDTGIYNME